jgi:cytochrome P450
VTVKEQLRRRAVDATVRFYQWRGDPVALWMSAKQKADPYPLYEDIRARGLARSGLGVHITAGHAMAERILRDRRFSASALHRRDYRPPSYPDGDPRAELPDQSLLFMDPPDHTRLRRLVSSAFTPKAVADLEPHIRDITAGLLDAADPRGGFDLIDALAFPLPMAVICRLLGVPAADQAQFRAWGHEVAATLEPMTEYAARTDPRRAELELTAYLGDLVARRRADPDDSLLSAMIAAEEEGDRLTSGELVSTAILLLVAGFETTVNLIGNGTVALLREPDQWRRLHDEPALIPGAIEELLRYDSPVQLTARTATEDLDLDGRPIVKGTTILVAIGGANRDPAVFDEPARLVIDRPNATRHLSFSLGIHHCLGAALARLEARVALEELTRRYQPLQLTAAPTRRPLLVLRGYEHVPVRAVTAETPDQVFD